MESAGALDEIGPRRRIVCVRSVAARGVVRARAPRRVRVLGRHANPAWSQLPRPPQLIGLTVHERSGVRVEWAAEVVRDLHRAQCKVDEDVAQHRVARVVLRVELRVSFRP